MFLKLTIINLGGPRNTEEILKFLLDLFRDPFVFDLPIPEFFRYRLATRIATKRAPVVADSYKAMGFGGGSPLYSETVKQAEALKSLLEKKTQKTWEVRTMMTCGEPNIRNLKPEDLIPSKENIFLPLFPQYSRSTTMSLAKIMESITGFCPGSDLEKPCKKECRSREGKFCPGKGYGWISSFSDDPEFIKSISDLIIHFFLNQLDKDTFINYSPTEIKDWETIPILFSAHGIPMRLIKKGDIYQKSIEDNAESITSALRSRGYKGQTFLSYQSRVGPGKWTSPNTIDKLKELGQSGIKRIAIYPISFVSDHLETLIEIGEELKEIARESGITEYHRIPAPGSFPAFIDFLANLVIKHSEGYNTDKH